MTIRSAQAIWNGSLKEGKGKVKLGSGTYEGPYSFASRFEEAPGTNPEELVGAAHAGCYSMFLSALLTDAGLPPKSVSTTAKVHLEAGPTITRIELATEVEAPGLGEDKMQELAAEAKAKCPVSKALACIEITLTAKLVG
jgi:lipoyl-dependent peroxiredoxin